MTALDDSPRMDLESPTASERLRALLGSPWLPWLAVVAGIVLRLARYVDDRSLWLDESFLALNIVDKSFGELLGALDYLQSAPPLFLLVEKTFVSLLGDDELALRLFPLVSGIAALVLFRSLAMRILTPGATLLALTLFAVNEPLVYYSAEAKPYSTDVAAAVLLVLLYVRLDREGELPRRALLPLAIAGVVAIWISYPAAFVLAPLGLVLLIRVRHEWRTAATVAAVGLVWLANFAVLYFTSRTIGTIEDAIFDPGSAGDSGAGIRLLDTLDLAWGSAVDPGGFPRPSNWLAALLISVGLVAIARRSPPLALVLAGPAVIALAAGHIGKYPVGGRFWLFLVPAALILLGAGVQWIGRALRDPIGVVAALVLAALVLVAPGAKAVENLTSPPRSEHVKPLLRLLDEEWREGDSLYVYSSAQFALRYYSACENCDVRGPFPWPTRPVPSRPGTTNREALESEPPEVVVGELDVPTEELRDGLEVLGAEDRVWLFISHDLHGHRQVLLDELGRSREIVREEHQSGARLYLLESRG